jgi:hypothetical protein
MCDHHFLRGLVFLGLAVSCIGCSSPGLDSIQITPAVVSTPGGQHTQFTAMGTYQQGTHSPTTQNLTNSASWASSNTEVATVSAAGVVTAVSPGETTITASSNGVSGVISGSAYLSVASAVQPALPTLTIYKVGNNAATGTVTGLVSGGTVPVINCGSGAGCLGNFPVGSQVVLTATPGANSSFGGWSSNCVPSPNNGPSPSATCTVTVTSEDFVGAIFN